MATITRWTDEEDEVLQRGLADGKTRKQLTADLPGRTERAIALRARRLRKPFPTGRAYARWSEAEDTIILNALAQGLTQGGIEPLIPGRNTTQVQNRIRILRCRQRSECVQCGGPLGDNATDETICDGCRDIRRHRSKVRYDDLRSKGICTMCGIRPANASLTLCEECLEGNRSYNPKREVPRTRNTSQGLIRWIGSPAVGPHVRRFPEGVKVVDLFGGSAAYALRAVEEGHEVVVYNDIHQGLVAFIEALRDGRGHDVWRLCRDLAKKTPAELVEIYKRATTLHREGLAAVTYTLARSSVDKNLRRPNIDEVYPPPTWRGMSTTSQRAEKALSNVEIMGLDYLDAIEALDGPDTFFFCDPPYPMTAKFEHNLTGRHQELMDRLNRIQGRYLLVFGSSRRAAEVMRSAPHVYMESCRRGHFKVRELLATNYEIDSEPLDWSDFGL